MIKVVPTIYSKIAIFRKKDNDYSNEDTYDDLGIDDNDKKMTIFFFEKSDWAMIHRVSVAMIISNNMFTSFRSIS